MIAKRPVFSKALESSQLYGEKQVTFTWHSGFAASQKMKSVHSLHEVAHAQGYKNLLEVSTKSLNPVGEALSAHRLKCSIGAYTGFVESIYQSSKVFSQSRDLSSIALLSPREARERVNRSRDDKLIEFNISGRRWSLKSRSQCYDWIYVTALSQNPVLSDLILEYDGFTDIEYNPKRQISCQARSCAIYRTLCDRNQVGEFLSVPEAYIHYYDNGDNESDLQIQFSF